MHSTIMTDKEQKFNLVEFQRELNKHLENNEKAAKEYIYKSVIIVLDKVWRRYANKERLPKSQLFKFVSDFLQMDLN